MSKCVKKMKGHEEGVGGKTVGREVPCSMLRAACSFGFSLSLSLSLLALSLNSKQEYLTSPRSAEIRLAVAQDRVAWSFQICPQSCQWGLLCVRVESKSVGLIIIRMSHRP